MRRMSALILSSRLPAIPPSMKCFFFSVIPPFGAESLNGHKKLATLLEVLTASVNFVNQIFDANDPLVAKHLLDHGVVRERDSLLVHLTVTTLVDQFSTCLQVRQPNMMYGSTLRSWLSVALLARMKIPLWI